MQKQRRNNQETIMQQWSSVSVPPQGMYVTVSLSSSLRTKALHPGGDWAQESWNATILPQNPNLKKVYTQWKIRKTWPLPHMNNGDLLPLFAFSYCSWGSQGKNTEVVFHFLLQVIFFFLGSKITVDGHCSCEIKRHLLLGRKAMTKLDSILKSRDITSPTMVHLVKAMVFPVVMYGYESWTWRKLSTEELMLLNCGVGEDSWESLGLQGDPTSPF